MKLKDDEQFAADFRWPTTRYQGSKRKILPWIWKHLKSRHFDSVLDVFGGTGSVSYLFKRMGKRVTYNDYLRWNHLVGTALIENSGVKLTDGEVEILLRPINNTNRLFVSRTFSDMYFTDRENLWIDALVSRISELKGGPAELKYKRAIAFYGLFQTCLVKRPFNLFHRVNLSLRKADVERSFGNKTTWERPFAHHFRAFIAEIHSYICKSDHRCLAINFNAVDIPAARYDLVYLDPPYIKEGSANETADYARCYHFLEGLARYDEWPGLIDPDCSLKSFSEDSEWTCSKSNKNAFEALFERFKDSTIVISYKRFGNPSIDTLARMLKSHGKSVSIHSRHYKYALNQQNGSAKLNRECLIIAE